MLKLLERDEQARKIALEAGNKAGKDAIKRGGYSSAQIEAITKDAMLNALRIYKPTNVTIERGIDTALAIRDNFINDENQREGIISHEVDINDL